MQEAVHNAVLQMGDDKTTVLNEEATAPQKVVDTANHPLALMLNYGDDEDDDEDDDDADDDGGASAVAKDQRCQSTAMKTPVESPSAQTSTHSSDDPLASFLNALNDEGLLDDEGGKPGTFFRCLLPPTIHHTTLQRASRSFKGSVKCVAAVQRPSRTKTLSPIQRMAKPVAHRTLSSGCQIHGP